MRQVSVSVCSEHCQSDWGLWCGRSNTVTYHVSTTTIMLLRIELVIIAVWTTSAMASITFSCFSYPLFDFPSLGFSSNAGLYQIKKYNVYDWYLIWSLLFSSNFASFGKYFLDEARRDWWSWRTIDVDIRYQTNLISGLFVNADANILSNVGANNKTFSADFCFFAIAR